MFDVPHTMYWSDGVKGQGDGGGGVYGVTMEVWSCADPSVEE